MWSRRLNSRKSEIWSLADQTLDQSISIHWPAYLRRHVFCVSTRELLGVTMQGFSAVRSTDIFQICSLQFCIGCHTDLLIYWNCASVIVNLITLHMTLSIKKVVDLNKIMCHVTTVCATKNLFGDIRKFWFEPTYQNRICPPVFSIDPAIATAIKICWVVSEMKYSDGRTDRHDFSFRRYFYAINVKKTWKTKGGVVLIKYLRITESIAENKRKERSMSCIPSFSSYFCSELV
jgi:hypothetical protein